MVETENHHRLSKRDLNDNRSYIIYMMYTRTHIYIRIYVCIYVYIYIYIYVCIYIHIHVCVCVCVCRDYHLSHALIICDGFQFQPSLYCFTEFVDFRTRSVN